MKEAFYIGIVPAIAFSAHAANNAMLGKQSLKVFTSVLTAAI